MQLSTNSFDFAGTRYVVIFARDVTEKEQLRLEQTATLSHAALGIALTRDAALTRVHEAFAGVFAATPDTLTGRSLEGLLADPGTGCDALNAAIVERGRGGEIDLESALRRLHGTTFWGRLRVRPIDAEQPVNGEVWLIDDVTDRPRMQQALAAARDVAEEASGVLRRRHASKLLPIVALTAGERASERDEAPASGINAFLHKPIDHRALARTLTELLRRTRGRAQVSAEH